MYDTNTSALLTVNISIAVTANADNILVLFISTVLLL